MSEQMNQIENLLKRVFIFIEDGEWERADEYCEKVLDIDAENADAYLAKLLIELKTKNRTLLSEAELPFEENQNFKKVLRYGDEKTIEEIRGYNNTVVTRCKEKEQLKEQRRLEETYNRAVSLLDSAQTMENCDIAANIFRSISGFKDANDYILKCDEKKEACRKNAIYFSAKNKMQQPSIENYNAAKELLAAVPGWCDADELFVQCDEGIEKILEEQHIAQADRERELQIKRENAAKRAKKLKKVLIITVASLVVVAAGVFAIIKFAIPPIKYKNAMKHIAKQEYAQAYDLLEGLGDYKDCKKLLEKFTVKYETEIYIDLDGSEYVSKYQYDKNGNIIKEIYYDQDGENISSIEREYDKNSNILKYIEYDKDGNVEYHYEFEYDKNGNELKYIKYDKDGNLEKHSEYEYDKDGNKIKDIEYDKDDNVIYHNEYEYDKDGNKIKDTSYDQDGNVESREEWEYDKNGNKIKDIKYDRYGNVESREEWKYDKNGNIIKDIEYDKDGNVEYHYEWENDKNGNKIKEVEYESGVRTVTYMEYEYDKDGNATKCTWYDQYRKVLGHSEWEYDKNGNELKYIRYNKDGNVEIQCEYNKDGNLIKRSWYYQDGNVGSQYEYDKNGNILKCIVYDEDGNVEDHFEREYDKYGNMTKEISYDSDGEIKSETENKYKDPVWFYDLKEKEEKEEKIDLSQYIRRRLLT